MNLKQKINEALTKKKFDEDLLKEISDEKSKLVIQKNFDSNTYMELTDIEQSLYRYNSFVKYGMRNEAVKEARKLSEMVNNSGNKDTILHGEIKNLKYIWHTEPDACEECRKLDGTVYYIKEDIPEKPHPNCKCSIEEVSVNEDNCDCSKLIQQIDDLLTDINKLRQVISISSTNLKDILSYDLSIKIENVGQALLENFARFDTSLGDLANSFVESRNNIYENSDKYYHMNGYCKVGQRKSRISSQIALGVGKFRELYQGVMSVITQEKSLADAIKEYNEDTNANNQGYELGKHIPNLECDIIIDRVFPYKIWEKY